MRRHPIATRYAALVAALLSITLVTSWLVETWASHRERQEALQALQRVKAQAAADAVSRFIADVQRNLQWVSLAATAGATPDELQQRRLDFLKLLRLEPAITTATLVDSGGRERLRVSRIKTNRIDSGAELSGEPGFAAARGGQPYFGDVHFVSQTEPYLTIAVPGAGRDGSVVLADVNLKFVQTVVSEIKVGETGYAYVVDARGRLISHPDLSLVLRMTDLSPLPQLRAATAFAPASHGVVSDAVDAMGVPVLAAYSTIAPLGWIVFVEQPRAEALAPLWASLRRSALVLGIALVAGTAAGIFAARRMVQPIAALRRGALRFGSGDLAHRIEVASGDELEELATQFNGMAGQLREIHASLERRVAERTQELNDRNAEVSEALEQQTATAEILRAISSAPTDVVPVFETIATRAVSLCRSLFANVFLYDGEQLHFVASHQARNDYVRLLRTKYPMRPDRSQVSGRVILGGQVVRLEDALADAEYDQRFPAAMAWRRMLGVPMLREGKPIGAIVVGWAESGPVPRAQEELLETFADQAVIALESVRLLRELRERNDELSIANQAKSRFLAAASHDLRQPMHALALFVDQLRTSRARADRTALTRRIEEAVGSMSELLDQLLDLSKLEAGAVQVVQQDFAVRDLLAAVVTQFSPLARVRGVELRVVPSSVWARSDPVLVQRIMSNLVANAIRYTERGGVLVGCRRRGGRIRLAVWDTGCGIPEERRHDVFREFVQLGGSDARRAAGVGRGLGLGLAIVARLADLLGSSVELRSTVGRGSMFAFELPAGASGMVGQPGESRLRASDLRGTFVLVIDDDETARVGMCGLLQRWGCLTLAAADGDEAVSQLQAHDCPPELIVSDYRLRTAETGLDAIERVWRAVNARVPAIIVTADTTGHVFERAQVAAVPLLHKPVSPIKLRALVSRLLSALDDRASAASAAGAGGVATTPGSL